MPTVQSFVPRTRVLPFQQGSLSGGDDVYTVLQIFKLYKQKINIQFSSMYQFDIRERKNGTNLSIEKKRRKRATGKVRTRVNP